jgi:hypothetical protein
MALGTPLTALLTALERDAKRKLALSKAAVPSATIGAHHENQDIDQGRSGARRRALSLATAEHWTKI